MKFRRHAQSKSQHGYVLLMLLLGVTLMAIALAAAVPRLGTQIKRDRETEMIHRGEQYARAIKKYYKKFGRYPTRIEELENTNNIRFLRKRYKDPMSADGSWKLVRFGEVKLGQQGSTGSIAASGQQPQSPSGSLFGSSGQGSPTGSSQQSGDQSTGGRSGSSGFTLGASSSSGQSSSSSGLSGQTFGGGPFLGVASKSEAEGVHEFNNKRKYSEWLFVYDPNMDRNQGLIKGPYNPNAFMGQFGGAGTPAGNVNQQGTSGSPSGFGSSGSTSQPTGGFGSSGSTSQPSGSSPQPYAPPSSPISPR